MPWHTQCKEEGVQATQPSHSKKITLPTTMSIKFLSFLAGIAIATGLITTSVQGATVATIPQGMMTYNFTHGTLTSISLPLTANITYSGSVSAVTDTTISVADSPAPFTTSLTVANARYFVKLLSGNEKGRVMLVTANTASTLTLDTTDGGTQAVALSTANFNVAVGDTFEIFPADTLASIFGDNSAQNPLVLTGSTGPFTADTVGIFNPGTARLLAYYFNTTANCWELAGSSVNANNTILYPYASMSVLCRTTSSDASFVITGRVAEVPVLTKTSGVLGEPVYVSTGYATDITFNQLVFGSNWVTGASPFMADTVSIVNPQTQHYSAYYQENDSTWHQASYPSVDSSNVTLAAGGSMVVLQRANVSGASCFLSSTLPYSLD